MAFVFGVPPSGSSTRVLAAPVYVLTVVDNALPIGEEALKLLGGVTKDVVGKKNGSNFDESKIIIPEGVTPQNLKNFNLYDLLGFAGDLGDTADAEVIKRAYHRAVLKYHPDKAQYKTADGKEDRTVFLKIQEAFNVLSSESKRRAYDSQLPFDDRIPTEEIVLKAMAKGPHRFFKLYGAIFQRNARFAMKKPVPALGDESTPMDQVYAFYRYWVGFESWRDFTGMGAEYKPDDAQSREEKRYMQKENEKLAKKLKTKEMERLINLVNIAQKFDPRIAADKLRIQEAKDAVKNKKESSAKEKEERLNAAKAWHEAQEAAEATASGAGTTKADKEKLKKAQSKARNILRKLLRFSAAMGQGSGEYGILTEAQTELLCANAGTSDLDQVNDAMGGEAASKDQALVKEAGFVVVLAKLTEMEAVSGYAKEDEQIAKDLKKREVDDKAAVERVNKGKKPVAADVTVRDLSAADAKFFATSLTRYKAGRADRWQLVANFMTFKTSPVAGQMFTADECMIQAYQLSKK